MTGYPIILNGDHAEFEQEWAGRDPKERPDWPLPSFDARDWAEAFIKTFGERKADIDADLMNAWFANALMRGYDEARSRQVTVAFGSDEHADDLLDRMALAHGRDDCTCNVAAGSPQPQEHDRHCGYRVLKDAEAWIRARARREAESIGVLRELLEIGILNPTGSARLEAAKQRARAVVAKEESA